MTASIVKSVSITNMIAKPIVVEDRKRGDSKVVIDKIAVATTSIDEVGDKIFLCAVPSNAIIHSIMLYNDDLDSHGTPTLAADVGLYYSGIGSGQDGLADTVIDADCFATAITSLQAAVVIPSEVRFEVDDIVDIVKEAWEAGGLSTDPGGLFYIALTLTAVSATPAAGDIVIKVQYI